MKAQDKIIRCTCPPSIRAYGMPLSIENIMLEYNLGTVADSMSSE